MEVRPRAECPLRLSSSPSAMGMLLITGISFYAGCLPENRTVEKKKGKKSFKSAGCPSPLFHHPFSCFLSLRPAFDCPTLILFFHTTHTYLYSECLGAQQHPSWPLPRCFANPSPPPQHPSRLVSGTPPPLPQLQGSSPSLPLPRLPLPLLSTTTTMAPLRLAIPEFLSLVCGDPTSALLS